MKALLEALVKAQAEMTKPKKDATNPHFKSSYADLSSVCDACLPALNRHGIVVTQPMSEVDGQRFIETIFTHAESGETISTNIPMLLPQAITMQQLGSAMTYARRYGLLTLAGLAPDDDDGNAASKTPVQQQPKPMTDKTKKDLLDLVDVLPCFPSQAVFEDWIYRTCNRDYTELTEPAAKKTLNFLMKNKDDAKWENEDFRVALAEARHEATEAGQ